MGVEAQIFLPELNSTLGASEMAARTDTEGMDRRKAPEGPAGYVYCWLLKNACPGLTADSCLLSGEGESKKPSWE